MNVRSLRLAHPHTVVALKTSSIVGGLSVHALGTSPTLPTRTHAAGSHPIPHNPSPQTPPAGCVPVQALSLAQSSFRTQPRILIFLSLCPETAENPHRPRFQPLQVRVAERREKGSGVEFGWGSAGTQYEEA